MDKYEQNQFSAWSNMPKRAIALRAGKIDRQCQRQPKDPIKFRLSMERAMS